MSAIAIRHLSMSYKPHFWCRPKHALHALNLQVEEGEIFGYLGANGAGKTTTIKILVGLLRQSGGAAHIFGEDSRTVKSRQNVGFQPENPYFYEYLSAREALLFYGALCKLPRKIRKTRCEELLEYVGLRDACHARVGEFSKGMRQRLGIAQALIHQPKLVILDEPQSGLDPVGRLQVRKIIEGLREQRITVFFSSHILSDVEQVADRVGLLVKGRLQALGPVSNLVHKKVNAVEIILEGVSDALQTELTSTGAHMNVAEDRVVLRTDDLKQSDLLIRAAVKGGASVRSVREESESLEEYFMRINHIRREEVGMWSGGADK